MKSRIIILASICFGAITANAQEIAIADGTVTGCGGFLLDTGIAFDDYQNNESFTMTLCAEAPETIINLYWNSFILGTGDSMTIYDGADTSAPLIGTFMANDLQTTDITSSIDGCLTLVWESDDVDTGNFSAEITCGPPCIRPEVMVEETFETPWRICVDEEISLDASPTVFADGTTLATHVWDLGDNTTDETSWPVVTHSYSTPGAYVIQLYVIDDNDCNSGNTIDVLVEVSTTPSFEGTTEDYITCLGAEVDLTGEVTPTPWTGAPSSNFGGALFIPDDQSQCFDSEILVTGFQADQEITDVSDLENFFINFEHSYMGDLTITFICPNGQSMLAHANQGGATFLGEPVDDDQSDEPGIGYDYYWAPDATLGTWGEESGGTLTSGTYSSASPWDIFLGCPLNGVWSIEICDNLMFDNGFIFDWALTFDPSLYPEDLSFTPSIGLDCDSTYWTSAETFETSDNCNLANFTPESSGEFDFVYHAVDNHGCEYTQNVTVEVTEVTAIAPDDFTICPDGEFNMTGAVEFSNGALNDVIFDWVPAAELQLPTGAIVTSDGISEETVFTVTAYPNGLTECASSDEVTVSISELNVTVSPDDSTCPSFVEQLNSEVTFTNGNFDNLVYSWSPSVLLSATNIPDPTASGISEETTFTLEVFPEGLPQCSATDEVTFTLNPGPTAFVEPLDWCPGAEVNALAIIDGITDSLNWTNLDFDTYYGNLETLNSDIPGTYMLTVFGCGQSFSETFTVEAYPCFLFVPNVFSPNGDDYNETFYIEGIEFDPSPHLIVYNRWGAIIYENTNYKGNWKPTIDEASDGVYSYVLYTDNYGDKHGTVTILR